MKAAGCEQEPLVWLRGGGELGTAAGHGLARAGWRVLVLELELPRALRLGVCFAAAVVRGRQVVEGIAAVHCQGRREIEASWGRGEVPVWIGTEAALAERPVVLVDARMRQLSEPRSRVGEASLVIGIGPGFVAGRDADLVIESNRGPRLGRVIEVGAAEAHTGVPGLVGGQREARVLRAPAAGHFERRSELGAMVRAGDVVGEVAGQPVVSRLDGMVRGLKLSGVPVGRGHKVGDVDPRREVALLGQMTDKARAVAAGVLEAVTRTGTRGAGGAA